jgi:hypothetical protein
MTDRSSTRQTWPLSPTDLDASFRHLDGVDWYRMRDRGSWVIRAEWRPPGRRGRGPGNRVDVWLHQVEAGRRAKIRAELLELVLPKIVEWAEGAFAEREGWRLLPHSVTWGHVDGRLERYDE